MPRFERQLRLPMLLLLSVLAVRADVTLPMVLAEHMVLQRGLPLHIWGAADAGESVSVEFRGATRSATADELGRWSVYLRPAAPGGPFELTIKGRNTIVFKDVLGWRGLGGFGPVQYGNARPRNCERADGDRRGELPSHTPVPGAPQGFGLSARRHRRARLGALQPRDGRDVLGRGVLLRPGHPAETGCAAGTDRIGLGRHARRGVDQSSRAIRGRRLDAGVFRVEPYERWPGQGAAPASKAGARMGARRRPGEVGGSHASGPSVAAQRRQFVDAGGFV